MLAKRRKGYNDNWRVNTSKYEQPMKMRSISFWYAKTSSDSFELDLKNSIGHTYKCVWMVDLSVYESCIDVLTKKMTWNIAFYKKNCYGYSSVS